MTGKIETARVTAPAVSETGDGHSLAVYHLQNTTGSQTHNSVLVTSLHPIDGSRSVLAIATVRIRGLLEINRVRVMQGATGPWIAWPSTAAKKEPDAGKPAKYWPLIKWIDEDAKQQAEQVLLKAWQEAQG